MGYGFIGSLTFQFWWFGFNDRAPYTIIRIWTNRDVRPPYNNKEKVTQKTTFGAGQKLILILGLVLAFNYFIHFLIALSRKFEWAKNHKVLGKRISTSYVRGCARGKLAATRKVNLMLKNASCLHKPIMASADRESLAIPSSLRGTSVDPTFHNYVLHGEKRVQGAGDFGWTWNHIISGRLFDTEGIWLPTRLIIFQSGQLIFGLFIGYAYFIAIASIAIRADNANATLPDGLPQWVYDIVPTGRQVKLALYPAASVGTVVMLLILLVYMPR